MVRQLKGNWGNILTFLLATLSGFTIEYKNYYKVVTNVITNKVYCLVGWNQTRPDDCSADSSFSTPIREFNFASDAYNAIPFIELLDIQDKLSGSVPVENITSPCILDGSQNTQITYPEMVLSSKTVGKQYVSFSGNDDSLGPLEVTNKREYIIDLVKLTLAFNRKHLGYYILVSFLIWKLKHF